MLDELHIEIIDTSIFIRHHSFVTSDISEFVFHFENRWSRRSSEKFIIEMVKHMLSIDPITVTIHDYRVLNINEYRHPSTTTETLYNEGYERVW